MLPGRGVHFRVWAPKRRRIEVVLESGPGAGVTVPLVAEQGGTFSALVPAAGAGSLYRIRLDGEGPFPDPWSRFQPDGPHGPSRVVDPAAFPWSDQAWRGLPLEGQVMYEMHLGTFTSEGTWAAAARELPELAAIGITVVEAMPVAEFPGRFGWGYDGVDLFAPTRLYGEPDDMRRFVDQAHALGVAVILDVVYNHLGPDGNYLGEYTDELFSDRHENEWGRPLNYDGPGSRGVRELVIANAGYWIDEFHLDGLRLDATQDVHDASPEHVLAAITRRVREAAGGRETIVVAENEPQQATLLRAPGQGGFGLDAIWNDDFHHAALVALTGRRDAYYTDYRGAPQELVSAVKRGFLYQGQRYAWQQQRRGTPALDVDPCRFVLYLENHDQVANSAWGLHLCRLSSPPRWRALTALLLLSPGTPLLFQGQEFAASNRFSYFADHGADLAQSVRAGRALFLGQFPGLALPEMQTRIPDPSSAETFALAKLDFGERESHAEAYALHRDLLRLRREDPVLGCGRRGAVDGAVLGAEAFVLRFFGDQGDRLLLVNLGADLVLEPAPEPLLAPPEGGSWEMVFSTEHPRYGGGGMPAPRDDEAWRLPAESALLLRASLTVPLGQGR